MIFCHDTDQNNLVFEQLDRHGRDPVHAYGIIGPQYFEEGIGAKRVDGSGKVEMGNGVITHNELRAGADRDRPVSENDLRAARPFEDA